MEEEVEARIEAITGKANVCKNDIKALAEEAEVSTFARDALD